MACAKHIETRLFINGEFCESSDHKTFNVVNPATLEPAAQVHEASQHDTDRAVAAAKAALPGWLALSPKERGQYLRRLGNAVRGNRDELAMLEASSMGKPVSKNTDASECADLLDFYAQAGHLVQGSTSIQTPGYINMTLRQPYGVVAAIIPWNVPLLFLAKKLAPALIVGNTVVLKSSEKAPLTSAKVATLIQEIGFPPGVINVITGSGNVSGAVLSHHMDVRALSFTGSTRAGRLIQTAAAKSNLKAVFLELGGKSPAIVFDDADLDHAAEATAKSMQANSGQVCMANSRIYVQRTIVDRFLTAFKKRFEQATIGDPLHPGTTHGPQADLVQHQTIQRYLTMGKTSGGKLLLGGSVPPESTGYFIQPTIFTDTPEDAAVMREEIFGPVVNINTFSTESEALNLANDSEFGLYAAVFTRDLDRAMRFATRLEAGTVGVNCTSPENPIDMPFGGYKASGNGREGEPLRSMDNFLETKTVMIKVARP